MASVIENLLAQPVQYSDPLGSFTKGITGGVEMGFNIAAKQYEVQRQKKLLEVEAEKNKQELLVKAFDLMPKIKAAKGAERTWYLNYMSSLAAKGGLELPPELRSLLEKSPEATINLADMVASARAAVGDDPALLAATVMDRMKQAGMDPSNATYLWKAMESQDKLNLEKYKSDQTRIQNAEKELNEAGAPLKFRESINSLPLQQKLAAASAYKSTKDRLDRISTDIIRNPQKLELINTPEQKQQLDDLAKLVEVAQSEIGSVDSLQRMGPLVDQIEASANALFNQVVKEKQLPKTDAQKAIDTKFAGDYQDFIINGGIARDTIGLPVLDGSIDELKKDKMTTGRFLGLFHSNVFTPTQVRIKQNIEKAIQPLLRPTFGAQFTEDEAKAFFARVFNPSQPESVNIERIGRLRDEMMVALEIKKSMVDYFEKNGTIAGYPGLSSAMSFLNKDAFEMRVMAPAGTPIGMAAPVKQKPASTNKTQAPATAPSTAAPAGEKESTNRAAFNKLFGSVAAPKQEAQKPKAQEPTQEPAPEQQPEENPFSDMSDEEFFEMLKRGNQGE